MNEHSGGPDAEALAQALFEAGAIRFGAFRLKLHEEQPDAPLSPLYIDLRLLRSYPDQMDVAITAYRALLTGLDFDLLADIPMAATPFGAILSHLLRVPQITPRQLKSHGSGAAIDGAYQPGQTAVLIDDLVTRAESKLEAARVLTDHGLVVRDIVVLIDREQGGAKDVAAAGLILHAAIGLGDLLAIYRRSGVLDAATDQRIRAYLKQDA